LKIHTLVSDFIPKYVPSLPMGFALYPYEVISAFRKWLEWYFPCLIHDSWINAGGHFPAWDKPFAWVKDSRSFTEKVDKILQK
jgi:hypothetical protein